MGKTKSILDVKSFRHKRRSLFRAKHSNKSPDSGRKSSKTFVPSLQRPVKLHTNDQEPAQCSLEIREPVIPETAKTQHDGSNTSSVFMEQTSAVNDSVYFDCEELAFQTLDGLMTDGKTLQELLEERPLSDDDDGGSDDEFCDSSQFKEEQQLKTDLRNWHKKYGVTNVALCALLLILRSHACFSFLPKSDKTFLHTPKKLDYDTVGPGKYHHIGLESTLKRVKAAIKETLTKFRLLVGIDEVPIFKSAPSGMIPIMVAFLGVRSLKKVVLPIGIYYGPKKGSVSEFLKKFVEEATRLIKNGIDLEGTKVKVVIEGFICDTPGKAYILNTKGHRGYSSCTKCKAEGEDYMNRMTFPSKQKMELRTHEDFLNMADDDYHMGETPLAKLPGIDFLHSFPLDTMHIVYLGIVRSILYLWIFAKPPKKIPFHFIDCFSKSMLVLKYYMPCEFNRKGRSMNEIRRWKATEFRTFLLYQSIIVLKDLQADYPQLYINFLTLHVLMRILLNVKHAKLYGKYAESLIDAFYKDSERLYGQEFLTSNMHALRHLPMNLERFESLGECDAFKIENALHSLKKLTRKPAQPLEQTCTRLEEFSANDQWFHNAPDNRDPVSFEPFGEHSNGPLLPKHCNGKQFKKLKMLDFTIGTENPDYCLALSDKSVIIVRNIFIPNQSKAPVIIGQKFNSCENFFPEPLCNSAMLGIHLLDKLEAGLTSWSLSEVSEKLVLLPYQNKNVCIPLLQDDA